MRDFKRGGRKPGGENSGGTGPLEEKTPRRKIPPTKRISSGEKPRGGGNIFKGPHEKHPQRKTLRIGRRDPATPKGS